MSWINRVRNAVPFLAKKESTAETLWHKCPSCTEMIFIKEWEDNLSVCPRCDHHGRIGPSERFEQILDAGFMKAARAQTGDQDALINARGAIDDVPLVMGVQNFAFMGGSMGMGVGAAFIQGVNEAIGHKCPYVIFTAAGGARMQEGILSLMQMPRSTVAIQKLHAAGLPYIVVLTDPTTGGVTASYAMLGDVQIAEPNALIGFAGQRVIESTIREKLPDGFQRAEYLLEHGMLDMVVHRSELRDTLARVIGYLAPRAAA